MISNKINIQVTIINLYPHPQPFPPQSCSSTSPLPGSSSRNLPANFFPPLPSAARRPIGTRQECPTTEGGREQGSAESCDPVLAGLK